VQDASSSLISCRFLARTEIEIALYQRIARFYDLLDLPFEQRRYRAIRPLLFEDMAGQVLDAGVGTGRNCAFYPPAAIVSGIVISPAMLARARSLPDIGGGRQALRDGRHRLKFADGAFDASASSFLFCVLPAPRELGRVVKPGGVIRLLEYVRPKGTLRRFVSYLWQPWIFWAYGASFDRQIERHVPAAGLELVDSRYVVDDLLKLLTLRVPGHVVAARGGR
jgi:SAM-dependent methyltransferase